jgi:hypothetical protein
MMAAQKGVSPGGLPPVQQVAAAGQSGAPRVRLTVEGGPRGEEYRFFFEVSTDGVMRYQLASELSGHRVEESTARVTPAEVTRLLRGMAPVRSTSTRQARTPPIPPCSVLGRLEFFDGDAREEVIFMADPEQAREAGHRTPAAVKQAVDRIYALAAKEMGLKTAAIRP